MQVWAKRYAIVFGLGFTIYAYAVGVQAATGTELAEMPVLRSLRYLGGGLMLVGSTLWIAKSRIDGNRAGLNPMFGLLLAFSTILLILGTLVTVTSGTVFLVGLQAGLASGAAALVIGVLASIIAPPERQPYFAYPWMNPEFDTKTDAYAAGMVVPTLGYGQSDDLTQLPGIDEPIGRLLNEAGIRYFSQLAETSPQELEEVLTAGGLSGVDPTSWPDRALLAANGDWDALKEVQPVKLAEQPA